MRKSLGTAVLLFCGFVLAMGALSLGQHPQVRAKPNAVFTQALSEIRAKSSVPAKLPSLLPNVDRRHPVYLIPISIADTGYNLLLGVDPQCEGQHQCFYGSFEGSRSAFEPLDKAATPVLMHGGIRGEFYDSECGAYCDNSSIRWSEHGFYYSISMNSAAKATLIRVANSAILTSSR